MKNKQTLEKVAVWVASVGAVNWLLSGPLKFNLVEKLLGVGSTLSMVAYAVVGASGGYLIWQELSPRFNK